MMFLAFSPLLETHALSCTYQFLWVSCLTKNSNPHLEVRTLYTDGLTFFNKDLFKSIKVYIILLTLSRVGRLF